MKECIITIINGQDEHEHPNEMASSKQYVKGYIFSFLINRKDLCDCCKTFIIKFELTYIWLIIANIMLFR